MKACPRCATVVVGTSMKCRQCGALLVTPPAPPPPPPPSGSGPAVTTTATALAEERFFAPATFVPVVVAPPAPRPKEKRRGPLTAIVVLIVVAACATGAYVAVHASSGSGSSEGSANGTKTPVTLPPIGANGGLPNVADAFRVQAEATRQHAIVVVAQASTEMEGTPLDAQRLRDLDPSIDWVTATESSTGPKVVSFSQSGETVVVAVATKSGDICAFGRWSPAAVGEYVTLGNVGSCRAADAPATGWTELMPSGGGS